MVASEAIPQPTAPLAWKQGQLIGKGAFGNVFKGLVHATGQEVAVKQVPLPRDAGKVSDQIRSLESEVAVLRTLHHENIVRYLGTERTEEYLNIFLEFVPGGSIANKLQTWGPLREDTIRVYAKQILHGLDYLHRQKIMHRDIKGANILVDNHGVIKLADFGASKKIEDLATIGGSRSIRGTPNYMAPEVIRQLGHGRAADIWSLGCVVIEMATGGCRDGLDFKVCGNVFSLPEEAVCCKPGTKQLLLRRHLTVPSLLYHLALQAGPHGRTSATPSP